MFVRIACERCAACGEVTPHSRPRIRIARWISIALAASAIGAALFGGHYDATFVLGVLALIVFATDRARHLELACDRCRYKAIRADRKNRPNPFDPNTIIDPI